MLILLLKISLITTVFVRLTEPEMIFAWYGKLIGNLPHWLYYPFGGCTKCFTGQVTFWSYPIIYFHSYSFVDHLFFASLGILLSLIYDKIWQICEQ